MSNKFSAKEKYAEAMREVGFRKSVYGRKVEQGTMGVGEMNRRVSIMEEIAEDYRQQYLKEEEANSLFAGQ